MEAQRQQGAAELACMPVWDDFLQPRLFKVLAYGPILYKRCPWSIKELVCPAPVGVLVRGVNLACLLFNLACHRILDLDHHVIAIRKLRRSLMEISKMSLVDSLIGCATDCLPLRSWRGNTHRLEDFFRPV